MKIKNQLPLERLIAKIDNDFNISESDWIPRVAAWTIDALEQINCLPRRKKTRQLQVNNRIACLPNSLNVSDIKVFDTNGCEIPNAKGSSSCCNKTSASSSTQMISIFDDDGKGVNFHKVATIGGFSGKNYVITENNQIELNFDADNIIVELQEVATYHDEYYDCDVPYIYDNGLLLEALAWYCLYKYLSRGSKHQVFDLKSPNKAINPYMQWTELKSKAASAVKIAISKSTDSGWNNFFYNSTFLPRG